MKILAIESSFDETAVAIVEDGTQVISSTLSSSAQLHRKFGGVLPELAARKQVEFILPIVKETIEKAFVEESKSTSILQLIEEHIDAIAVTVGPGLIGSLLVGVEAAKTTALVTHKPIIPINHVHAHIYANFIDTISFTDHLSEIFPAIALVVSGGHTELFYMENEKSLKWLAGTIDDAAGEAFDKTARLLGFENRGGIAIEEAATNYRDTNSFKIRLPRPLLHNDTFNFSFSGLKTAVIREWKKYSSEQQNTLKEQQIIFAHEIQETITDVLVAKTLNAAIQFNAQSILISGGVAANQCLRDKFLTIIEKSDHSFLKFYAPKKELCTDNAISIGSAAYFLGKQEDWHTITATPNLPVETSTNL